MKSLLFLRSCIRESKINHLPSLEWVQRYYIESQVKTPLVIVDRALKTLVISWPGTQWSCHYPAAPWAQGNQSVASRCPWSASHSVHKAWPWQCAPRLLDNATGRPVPSFCTPAVGYTRSHRSGRRQLQGTSSSCGSEVSLQETKHFWECCGEQFILDDEWRVLRLR